MPNIVREELWKYPGHPGMIVVTTNATITRRGLLVMGAGAAFQAKLRYPNIDKECAEIIQKTSRLLWAYPGEKADMDAYSGVGYYFQVVRPPRPGENKVGFGVFQVKVHFRDDAHLELIRRSAIVLEEYCRGHPDVVIRMNYPGIGYGRLDRKVVEPLLVNLPDNVTICYR